MEVEQGRKGTYFIHGRAPDGQKHAIKVAEAGEVVGDRGMSARLWFTQGQSSSIGWE
jgi:hypothetical protein